MIKSFIKVHDEAIRHDFSSFIIKSFSSVNPGAKLDYNWHIDAISEYLKACQKGEIKRLIINIPPRYLKSLCVSVAWPAWLLAANPSERIIVSSYAQSLSNKHSLDCRTILLSEWYNRIFPDVKIKSGQNQKSKFMTTKMGFRLATATGASVTGEGGNFLIIDDPHNPTTIHSDPIRDHTLMWFDKTFSTRLNDKKKGVFVVVMQRLHTADLSGYLLEKGGWEHLCLPAVAETETFIDINGFSLVRKTGDYLHSAREGIEEIERAKKELGINSFSAQYQQNPIPLGGRLIKTSWIKRYKVPPGKFLRVFASWDTANKTGKSNDFSVGTIWGESDNSYYLLDVIRGRYEYLDLKRVVINMANKYNLQAILIEDASSGQVLIQQLLQETRLPCIPIKVSKDKVSRFYSILPLFESARIMLPETAEWLFDYEKELFLFPNLKHDDQVDSTTQFLSWISTQNIDKFRIRKF